MMDCDRRNVLGSFEYAQPMSRRIRAKHTRENNNNDDDSIDARERRRLPYPAFLTKQRRWSGDALALGVNQVIRK